ncbi:MAG: T9SS type A sorting domain-containing protein [Bacteroidota bacterium]|nr:T9SS type A sorting domain-containing protein [Bacteroidota bacterium]MDP4233658.1 T9SS type A sorting domain-containing protein [Bacteroidota bacterium]MDP4243082.1 T9SS type A sorting domain-containing protein [Bacteroidota bacterium]MDP4288472.1 T9SS type A sorting domain-containing protein [Bacteroidota bacterium]
MKYSIRHIWRGACAMCLMSLLLVSFMLCTERDARALVTFSYTGSHQLVWTSNGAKTVTINRIGGYTPLSVDAYLSGSKKFSLDYQNVYWPDSSQDTGYMFPRYFSVRFSSSANDTSIAYLVLSDSVVRDTIELIGYGTQDSRDFTVSDTALSIFVSDSTQLGGTTSEWLYNRQSSSIYVVARLSDSTNWDLDGHGGSESILVSSFGSRAFNVNYKPHGVYHDNVTITLTCASPYYQQRIVTVQATDNHYAPVSYVPTVTAPDLGEVQPGDSACGTVTISNHTSQAITITYIRASDSTYWSLQFDPLPFAIPAGGSRTATVCFHPPQGDIGDYAGDRIYVSYRDSNGMTGTVADNAYAHTPAALEAIRDSLRLDDVIVGGYVEATAIFVAHKNLTLAGGSSYVSGGGSVSIIAPSMPHQMHSGDTVSIRIRVTPSADTAGYYWGYIPLSDTGWSGEIVFQGQSMQSSTSDLQLFPAQSELLALTTSSQVTVDTFWFVNNYSGAVHIPLGGVHLAQGTYFSILGEIPRNVPDTLTSSQKLGVIVQFSGDTNGFYHDSLYIDADYAIQSLPINLEAVRTGVPAAVHRVAIAGPAQIWLAPNPALGPVAISIDNAERASIDIFDVLGNRVAVMPNAISSSWDPTGLSGGIYIIRASGMDQNGDPFAISKRLVLAR